MGRKSVILLRMAKTISYEKFQFPRGSNGVLYYSYLPLKDVLESIWKEQSIFSQIAEVSPNALRGKSPRYLARQKSEWDFQQFLKFCFRNQNKGHVHSHIV